MNSPMKDQAVSCRVAACHERLDDQKEWTFYLINDGPHTIESAVLKTFGHEWGDFGRAVHPNAMIEPVHPGSAVQIWRDNDGEMRMWLEMLLRIGAREFPAVAEFPLLYRTNDSLPLVGELNKPGYVVTPTPSARR